VRHAKVNGKDRLLYLHRQLMGPQEGQEVLFRNHDTLDCRRENLRVVSKQEARQHHRRARSNSRSGVKGITYNRRPRPWSVDVYRNGRARRVGTFLTLKEPRTPTRRNSGARTPTCTRRPRWWSGQASRRPFSARTWM